MVVKRQGERIVSGAAGSNHDTERPRGKLENLLTCKVRSCMGNAAIQNSIKRTFVTFSARPLFPPCSRSVPRLVLARLFARSPV